ncbi:hypothetical protein BD311DRAFT_861415 [Dichomitus squalens]|uniref:FAD-binding domain-containing protein n=1 Tax=Dichomitus squalens TaxID=114155 RepID=A0A4Q9N2U7_9APHY|nr:hypothetical protein BD311DRAFT_861415 [Dichomitus squalens]
MATTTHPRIAIIGRGPGGLTLALTLHRRGVPFTVYERETSADSRARLGGILDLGYESGQRALRENGLGDIFARNSRPEADSTRVYDSSANLLFARDADPNQTPLDIRPEIDRSLLRKILLDAVPANTIKWGHELVSVRDLGDGERELKFTNGNTATVDILVGADGAHSRWDGDGRMRTYIWFPGPADWSDPAEARKVHVSGVTILGDAAQFMSPFGGAGDNLAMLDALELGIVLTDALTDAINSRTSVKGR